MLKKDLRPRQLLILLVLIAVGAGFAIGFYAVPSHDRGVYVVCLFALYMLVHIALTIVSARAAKRRRHQRGP